MLQHIFKKFVYISILLWIHILTPSILKNTPIKTPFGPTKVENLTIGDSLIGYKNKQLVKSSITNISVNTTNTIIIITTNKGDVFATPHQLFYDPIAEQWIAAKKITPDTILLDSQNNHCACLNVRIIPVPPTTVYNISTTDPHTFFVYDQELLTHNTPPIIIGLTWLFGGGIEFLGATISSALFGTVFGIEIYKSRSNTDARFALSTQKETSYGGYNPDPNDDENKRKFNTISKSEFFKKVENEYEYWRDGVYKRKHKAKGFCKKTEYIKWDHLHNDVEAYNKYGEHLGSYNPNNLKLYKGPDLTNKIYIR